MTQKILAGMISVVVLVIVLCGGFLIGILYDYFNDIVFDEMESQAFLISRSLADDGDDFLDNLSSSPNRITIIESNGKVCYDSDSNISSMGDHSSREEVAEAFEHGSGKSSRYSDTVGMQTLYYAEMMPDGRVLRIAIEVNSVWTLVLGVLQPMIFVLILAAIVAALISRKIASHITKPINEIDLNDPDLSEPYDELSPLIQKIRTQNGKIHIQMKKLKRQQKEFSIITENMSEGILIIDNKTEILSHNNAALRLLNADENGPAKNKSILELNRSSSLRDAVSSALNGEYSEQPLNISEKYYHISANPVFHSGKVTGAVILIFDVTEKENREHLRREFTSNVSHELKTPLTTIYGISDMICAGIVKPEDISNFAGSIRKESKRMIELIDDIIRLSQLDEGAKGIEKTDIDLLDIANSVVERLRFSAEKADINLTIDGESSIIVGAYSIVEEMIFNLVDNAIKYNKKDGSIKIHISDKTISVSDTGIGIPTKDQERVFERFYRVDKSHSRKIGGTGLGLSIVKHGAAFHNASIQLESVLDKGTNITIKF